MESQEVGYSDIEKTGKGGFSLVYAIGDQVLKIGKPRGKFQIPNHKRILQPFYRGNFANDKGEDFACIEISDKIETLDESQGIDLYEIYKELRESGIVWSDIKLKNLGRLKGLNMPTYEGKKFDSNPEFNGLLGKVETTEILNERRNCYFRY